MNDDSFLAFYKKVQTKGFPQLHGQSLTDGQIAAISTLVTYQIKECLDWDNYEMAKELTIWQINHVFTRRENKLLLVDSKLGNIYV